MQDHIRCHHAENGIQCDIWVPTEKGYKPPIFCASHGGNGTRPKMVRIRCEYVHSDGVQCHCTVVCEEDAESPIYCAEHAGIDSGKKSATVRTANTQDINLPIKLPNAEYLKIKKEVRDSVFTRFPKGSAESVRAIEEFIREKELEIKRLELVAYEHKAIKAEWIEGMSEEELRSLRGKTPKTASKVVLDDKEKKLRATQRRTVESIVNLMSAALGRQGAIDYALKTLGSAGKLVVSADDFNETK